MKWSKPKYVLNKIAVYFSLLSILVSVLAVSIYISWQGNAYVFTKLDQDLPDYYSENILNLVDKIKSPKIDAKSQFNNYKELKEALKGSTNLHKYNSLVNDVYIFLINKWLSDGNLKRAKKLASEWQNIYPNDFNAKFKYAEIIGLTDKKEMLDYYQVLYHKHKDIYLILSKYVDALLAFGEFERALFIAQEAKNNFINNTKPDMIIYFKDKNIKKFSYLGSRKITQQNIRVSQGVHHIQFNNKIESLSGIKLHINSLKLGSNIENILFSIKTDSAVYQSLAHRPVKHIKRQAGKYLVVGKNPGVEFNLPKEIQGYSGPFEISIQLKLTDNKYAILNKILHHPQWRYNFSQSMTFDQEKSQQAFFEPKEKRFVAHVGVPEQKQHFLRLHLPAYKNLTLSKFEVSFVDSILTSSHIIDMQDIEVAPNGMIKVIGTNPYIEFNLGEKLKRDKLLISFGLGDDVE